MCECVWVFVTQRWRAVERLGEASPPYVPAQPTFGWWSGRGRCPPVGGSGCHSPSQSPTGCVQTGQSASHLWSPPSSRQATSHLASHLGQHTLALAYTQSKKQYFNAILPWLMPCINNFLSPSYCFQPLHGANCENRVVIYQLMNKQGRASFKLDISIEESVNSNDLYCNALRPFTSLLAILLAWQKLRMLRFKWLPAVQKKKKKRCEYIKGFMRFNVSDKTKPKREFR